MMKDLKEWLSRYLVFTRSEKKTLLILCGLFLIGLLISMLYQLEKQTSEKTITFVSEELDTQRTSS